MIVQVCNDNYLFLIKHEVRLLKLVLWKNSCVSLSRKTVVGLSVYLSVSVAGKLLSRQLIAFAALDSVYIWGEFAVS